MPPICSALKFDSGQNLQSTQDLLPKFTNLFAKVTVENNGNRTRGLAHCEQNNKFCVVRRQGLKELDVTEFLSFVPIRLIARAASMRSCSVTQSLCNHFFTISSHPATA